MQLGPDEEHGHQTSFAALVIMLSSSAWTGLGKIKDPVSGDIKKDLKAAKYSIDILLMLRAKTAGNLETEEKKFLDEVIADLQANYAETVFAEREGETASESKSEEIKE
jgi:hypothetical protein